MNTDVFQRKIRFSLRLRASAVKDVRCSMSDFNDLYQDLILDHQKSPRNFGDLPEANHHADGFNPLCGDKVSLNLKVDEKDVIQDIRLTGSGCAISKASSSMMTVALKGKTTGEAEKIYRQFHDMVMGSEKAKSTDLGKLKVFAGVKE